MKSKGPENDSIEIIDAHSHLGNILYEGGGGIIEQKGIKPRNRIFDTSWIMERVSWETAEALDENPLFRAFTTFAERKRNAGATLENMKKAHNQTGIRQACCLPIPPYVTFEDLKRAQTLDDRVIPFTGVDFNHMEDMEGQLRRNVMRGARGMKIHPIIQNISPTDQRVRDVIDEFSQYKLPILFHTGVSSYYFGEELRRENTEFGRLELIEKMAEDTRGRTNIILGHAGLEQNDYVIERMGKYPNVFADTSFLSPKRIRRLINAFGSERVLFGSDWPYSDIEPAKESLEEVLVKETDKRVRVRIFRDNIRKLIQLV